MMANKKFCARLRKAKKVAIKQYPEIGCIYNGCCSAKIYLGLTAVFDKDGAWDSWSSDWVHFCAKSSTDIAAVFDNSIRALGEEP